MAHSPARILIATLSISLLCNLVTSKSNGPGLKSKLFGCVHSANATISYQTNINLLLSDFNSRSSQQVLYYRTSVGNTPDTVFGYYMCRGDLKPESCYNCITDATQLAQQTNCDFEEGLFLSPNCIFRYTNHSTYRVWEKTAAMPTLLGGNVTNLEQYNRTLSSTMDAVINDAANGSNSTSILGFATKVAEVTGDEKIYSLAQCTPDIVGVNCSSCLRDEFLGLRFYDNRYQGASYVNGNCLLIYNNESFYNPKVGKHNKGEGLRPSNLIVIYSLLILLMYYTYLGLN